MWYFENKPKQILRLAPFCQAVTGEPRESCRSAFIVNSCVLVARNCIGKLLLKNTCAMS
jgi:hypothetical protein